MKKGTFFRYITNVSFILIYVVGCEKSAVEPQENENLIDNSSFESDEGPTLGSWMCDKCQLAEIINEAPFGGGSWSLQLTADWAPTLGYVYMPIKNLNPGDIIKLSGFIRAFGPDGGGIISLNYEKSSISKLSKYVSSTDTSWSEVSVIDTINFEKGDTLWVFLSSFHSEITPRVGLFDLITLEKLSNQ